MPLHFSNQLLLSDYPDDLGLCRDFHRHLCAAVTANNFVKRDSYVMMQTQHDMWACFKKVVHIYIHYNYVVSSYPVTDDFHTVFC